MEHKRYEQIATTGKSVLLGHNRAATVGRVNGANAHPFGFDHIVGAHNGTIPYSSRSDIPDGNKFDTDSEGIINAIDQLGVELVIPELYGAWALTWYDKRDHSVNFLRNNERPLCYTISESGKTIYWASEAWMLYGALARNNIKHQQVWQIAEDRHYKFLVPTTFNDEFAPPEERALAGLKEEKKRESRFQWGDYEPPGAPYGYVGGYRTPAVVKLEDKRQEKAEANVEEAPFDDAVEFEKPVWSVGKTRVHNQGRKGHERNIPIILGYSGEELTEAEFRRDTKEVCALCDAVFSFQGIYEGTDKVCFINRRQFTCEDCTHDPWAKAWYLDEDEELTKDGFIKKKD